MKRFHRVTVLAAMIIVPLVFWPSGRSPFEWPKVAALACFVIPGAAMTWLQGGFRVPPPLRSVMLALVGLVGWMVVRSIGVEDSTAALLRTGLWGVTLVTLVAVAGMGALGRRRALDGLILAAAGASVLGVVQGVSGWQPYAMDAQSVTFTPDRPASTFGNPIFFAGFLILTVPLTVGRWLSLRDDGSRKPGWWMACALACQSAALLLCSSRSALLGLISTGAVWAVARRVSMGWFVAAIGGLPLLIIWLPLFSPSGAAHLLSLSDGGRLAYWRAAGSLAVSAPAFGIGAGQYPVRHACAMVDAESPDFAGEPKRTLSAHNDYLETAAELGVIGIGLLLVAVILPLTVRTSSPIGDGARAGLGAFLVHALFQFPFRTAPLQAFVLVVVVAWLIPRDEGSESDEPRGEPSRLKLALATLVVLLAAAAIVRPLVRSGYLRAASLAQSEGQRGVAQAWYGAALRLLPDSSLDRVELNRALMHFAAGELGLAEVELERDAVRHPCTHVTWRCLGLIRLMRVIQGDRSAGEGCRAALTRALMVKPSRSEAAKCLNARGNLGEGMGSRTEAEQSYRSALVFIPGYRPALLNLARLLRETGRRVESERLLASVGLSGAAALAASRAMQLDPSTN